MCGEQNTEILKNSDVNKRKPAEELTEMAGAACGSDVGDVSSVTRLGAIEPLVSRRSNDPLLAITVTAGRL